MPLIPNGWQVLDRKEKVKTGDKIYDTIKHTWSDANISDLNGIVKYYYCVIRKK